MFCPNCGTEMADGSHFCIACGTTLSEQIYKSPSSATQKKSRLDTRTIVLIVLSAVMLLSMIALPMLKLARKYDRNGSTDIRYSIGLLENDLSTDSLTSSDTLWGTVMPSRVVFIFMAACVVAGVLFKMARKELLGFLCQIPNVILLICYFMFMSAVWKEHGDGSSSYFVIPAIGCIICVLCTVVNMFCYTVERRNRHFR